jgi:hypothetical protein
LGHRLKIMPITINGSGTVTGISAGGLPDDCIVTADIADNNVTTAKIANIGVTEIKIADGAVSQAKRSEDLTLETAKSATGTSVDFTGIPSWVKRITVMFAEVSTNGTSVMLIQIGAGSVTTSGYLGSGANAIDPNIVTSVVRGGGFAIDNSVTATAARSGSAILSLMGGNNWSCFGIMGRSDGAGVGFGGGHLPLGGTLDRVRITTANGTDTFDAGSINIMYE